MPRPFSDDLDVLAERLRLGIPLAGFDGREIPLCDPMGRPLDPIEAARELLRSGVSLLPDDEAGRFLDSALRRADRIEAASVVAGDRAAIVTSRVAGVLVSAAIRATVTARIARRQSHRPQPGDPALVSPPRPLATADDRCRRAAGGDPPDGLASRTPCRPISPAPMPPLPGEMTSRDRERRVRRRHRGFQDRDRAPQEGGRCLGPTLRATDARQVDEGIGDGRCVRTDHPFLDLEGPEVPRARPPSRSPSRWAIAARLL